MQASSFSFSKQIWGKLQRNPLALGGLLVIVLFVLVAIFGYWIAPDNSAYADLQTVEIQAKKPGYSQQFLKIPLPTATGNTFSYTLFKGKPSLYTFLPISGYSVKGDVLLVNKYVDEDTSVVQQFSISNITNNNTYQLYDLIVVKKYLLGTDAFGRDILSILIIGTRVSLGVGLIAVLISLTLGILLGALAG
ncbi:MAG: ABC transporter permease, partial [Ferruginibacter sp.]